MVARPGTVPLDVAAQAAGTTRSLFEQHARMVLAICRSLLRDPAEAEDAAQETFLSAHRSLLAGRGPRKPGAWLAAIARNECRARLRSSRPLVQELELEGGVDPDEAAADHAVVAELTAAIAELPPRQRESVVLRDLYGLTPREIASAMQVSTPVVDTLIYRARRRLRDRLAPLRRAAPALAAPVTALREALERAIPGFETASGPATAGAIGAGAATAKLVSLPAATKLAAAAVGVAAIGSAGGTPHAPAPATAAPKVRSAPVLSVSRPAPVLVAPAVDRSGPGSSERRGRDGEDRTGPGDGERGSGGSGSGSDSSGSGSGGSSSGSSGSGSDSGGSSGPSERSGSSGSGSSGSGSSGSGSSGSDSSGSESSGSGSSGDD